MVLQETVPVRLSMFKRLIDPVTETPDDLKEPEGVIQTNDYWCFLNIWTTTFLCLCFTQLLKFYKAIYKANY